MSEVCAGMMVTPNVRLARPLGAGGMGAVWVADHLSLHTQVVVKLMALDLTASPEALTRFSREAAAASQVKSPHVVQMLDHGILENGAPYIVMELLEGHDLEQLLRAKGALEPSEATSIVAQVGRALDKAHERGIVHRDIKPSNVFVCDAGGGEPFVKLLDFGIAKNAGRVGGIAEGDATRTGDFLGSPCYMSPEQVIGAKDVDFRTDLWSLGVVAFEALTGDKPFFAETLGALAIQIHRDPLPLPSRARSSLPLAVDAWFARACAREPAERFASASEMAEALVAALSPATQRKRRGAALGAVAAAAVGLVVGVQALVSRSASPAPVAAAAFVPPPVPREPVSAAPAAVLAPQPTAPVPPHAPPPAAPSTVAPRPAHPKPSPLASIRTNPAPPPTTSASRALPAREDDIK